MLGPVEVHDDDGKAIAIGQRKVRELLSVLALADGPLSSGQLQAMLWVAAETRNMVSALTTTMNRLRKLLPKESLVRGEDGYRLMLDPERDHLDVWEFRDLVAEARRVRETYPRRAADLFQQAVEVWRDPALPDLPGTLAAAGQAQRLSIERRDAIEALVEVQMALGRHAVVAGRLPAFLAEDPLNDRLWLALLLSQYRDGRKGDALRSFEDARAVFLTELGAEPSLSLQGMRDRVAANAPGLTWSSNQTVQESRAIVAGADVTVASPARLYDYLLGGDNNFEVDRKAAETILAAAPDLRQSAHDNRRFLGGAVRFLAERGIRQFLDIGAGLPTDGSVHEVARAVNPDARVVYVDHDPAVVAHGRAMIDDSRDVAFIAGDLIRPAEIFSDPQARRLLDPAEPIAVLMLYVLHFVPADSAHEALETYRSWMVPGSALAISHVTRDGSDPRATKALHDVATRSATQVFQRSRPEIEAMFAGLELTAPLDTPTNWRAMERTPDPRLRHLAGIGILTA
jgi:DNA-binding SARP family transcriptional activator/O-methyltransferase involved in polyketide biosynthesis